MEELEIAGLPCGLVEGLLIKRRGPWGTVKLPGAKRQKVELEASCITDEKGRASLMRQALVARAATQPLQVWIDDRGVTLARRGTDRDGCVTAKPTHPVVVVMSAPGGELLFGRPFATVVPGATPRLSQIPPHVRLLPAVANGEAPVFVDGLYRGAVDLEAAWGAGSRCLSVDDLPWTRGGSWLDVNVFGARDDALRLEFHEVGKATGIPRFRAEDQLFGTVTRQGGHGRGGRVLGHWTLESTGALRASVRLPRGATSPESHGGRRARSLAESLYAWILVVARRSRSTSDPRRPGGSCRGPPTA